jgi:hypothetical protein
MPGNTDFWRNDLFTRTGQPAPGNKTFGADRVRITEYSAIAFASSAVQSLRRVFTKY